MMPYYDRGGVRLYLGKSEDVLPTFAEKGVVIFDPPYSAHTHSKSRAGSRKLASGSGYDKGGNAAAARSTISREVEFGFAHLAPALRRLFAYHAARLSARWSLVFSDTESDWLWRHSLQARGLEYVRTAFWHKLAATPQFTGDRPAVAVEAITVVHPKGKKRWNGGGRHGLYPFAVVQGREGSIGEPRIHPTQKPEALMVALCEDFTDPGELIYDFTAGGCSTGIGALRARGGPRRFVGVEMDEKHLEQGAKRLDAELSGSTYYAAKAGQRPLFSGLA